MTIEKKADRDNSDNAETIVNKLEARELMLRFLTHGDMDGEQAETLISSMETCLTNLGYDPQACWTEIGRVKPKIFRK